MTQEEVKLKEQELLDGGVKHNVLTVFLDEDDTSKTATFFLRKPDKTVRGLIAKMAQKDGLEAVFAAIKNLYIGGDEVEILRKNDYALASAESAVVEMLQVQSAQLKKN